MEEKLSLEEGQISVERLGLDGHNRSDYRKLSTNSKVVAGEGNDGGLDGADGDGTDGDGADGDGTDGDGTDGRI